jgi:hypothetical protein
VIDGFGRVSLVYTDADGEAHKFAAESVTTSTAEGLGQLVSVRLNAPILTTTTLTLILPPVVLADQIGSEASIHALAITATGRDPEVLNRQMLSYKVVRLSGSGSLDEIPDLAGAGT